MSSELYYAQVLRDLHESWTPHEGQLEVGASIFNDEKKIVFVQCGRKWGKTEIAAYFCFRKALMNPNTFVYYIAPYKTQAREIIWETGRLQNFLKKHADKYIASITEQDMRITFKNGSFIKVDGADNYRASAGWTPTCAVYDEFRDHHPGMHEAFYPNMMVHDDTLLIIGTPPETEDNLYCKIAKECRTDPEYSFFNQPSSTNPHISHKFLEKERQKLVDRGEWDVWQREYMAQITKGGSNHIFPMFKNDMIVKFDERIKDIRHYRRNYQYYITMDPGTAKVFAVLFTAIHKYTKKVTHLTEVYAQSNTQTSVRKVWIQVLEKMAKIGEMDFDQYIKTYDEAGAWAANEISDLYGIQFEKTRKSLKKKDSGLSLIKDQMNYGFWECTDDCPFLVKEIDNYVKDKNGEIPKENDHLIDDMRYTNAAAEYAPIEESAPSPEREYDRFEDRPTSPEHDLLDRGNDPFDF